MISLQIDSHSEPSPHAIAWVEKNAKFESSRIRQRTHRELDFFSSLLFRVCVRNVISVTHAYFGVRSGESARQNDNRHRSFASKFLCITTNNNEDAPKTKKNQNNETKLTCTHFVWFFGNTVIIFHGGYAVFYYYSHSVFTFVCIK